MFESLGTVLHPMVQKVQCHHGKGYAAKTALHCCSNILPCI